MTTTCTPAAGTERLSGLSAVFLAISTLVVTIGVIIEHTSATSEASEAAEGFALESPLPIIVAIIVSVVLAVAMWRRPATATLVLFSLACRSTRRAAIGPPHGPARHGHPRRHPRARPPRRRWRRPTRPRPPVLTACHMSR